VFFPTKNSKFLKYGVMLVAFGIWFFSNSSPARAGLDDDIEISGLLIDETLTRRGRDFFYYFSRNWQSLSETLTIIVKERQDRGSSTSVLIFANDTLVYKRFLERLPDAVEESAKKAVGQVNKFILFQREALSELDYY